MRPVLRFRKTSLVNIGGRSCGNRQKDPQNPKGTWREIVGVVGNERDNGIDREAPTFVYWPLMIRNFGALHSKCGARSPSQSAAKNRLGQLLERNQPGSVGGETPSFLLQTFAQLRRFTIGRWHAVHLPAMLALAAGMALLLGVVGIYGVISYSISQRVREIGIRMALGATQRRVRFLFVRHGVLLAGTGVVCGVAAAIPLTRMMSALLFDVSPLDPLTYCAVSVALVATALLASYVPASRATRIEPVEALRAE